MSKLNKQPAIGITSVILYMLLCVGYPIPVWATSIDHTDVDKSKALEHRDDEYMASQWGLSIDEWDRYKGLRDGDAKYQFSQLDPIEILGIYAESESEQRRYALLLVERNARRLEKFLTFNRLYQQVGAEYFADTPFLDMTQFNRSYGRNQYSSVGNPAVSTQFGDTLVMFIDIGKDNYRAEANKILKLNQKATVTLEIYFLNKPEEKDIQSWAKRIGIETGEVESGKISLNYDQGESGVFNVGERSIIGFLVRGETATPLEL